MKNSLLGLAALFGCASLFAGQHVTVSCDPTNAVVSVNEEVTFTVAVRDAQGALMPTGAVTAVLDNIGSTVLLSNRMDLAKGNPFTLTGKLSEPGFLRVKVLSPEIANPTPYNKGVVVFSCAVDPFKFQQEYACPADFDAFWSAAHERLAREVPLDPQIALDPAHTNDADFVWYHVSFATFGRRVYGHLLVPKNVPAGTRLPVRVQVPGAGFGSWSNVPDRRKGFISFFLSVFPWQLETNFEPNRVKYDRMNDDFRARKLDAGTRPDSTCYHVSGITRSREDYFYYPVILGVNRAVDWLAQRPDVDPTRITYHGTSQGGMFGLVLMGLNRHFARGVVYVPALTGQHLREQGLEDTWPWFADAARANAAYFDTVNFAARVRCPIRFVAGLADTLCPPTGVAAAYNACPSSDKDIVFGIGMSHNVYGWIYQRLGDWEVAIEND